MTDYDDDPTGRRVEYRVMLSGWQVEALVRLFITWGYLGPEDCIDFDDPDFEEKFCKALGDAMPELIQTSDQAIAYWRARRRR
jgi:hypothetical protein